jgi:hypothetical protein
MAKNIVCTFASSQSIMNNREVAKVLGVDTRNIKKAFERWLLLDTLGSTFWTYYKRAKYSNSLIV